MTRLVSAIMGNPVLLLWLGAACLVLGAVSGAGGAWYIQGLRLDALQAEYEGFRGTVAAEGMAAKKIADAKVAADKKRKEESDAIYKADIARLSADNERLRDKRSDSGFVPPGPGPAGRPEIVCFDRAELERALRRLDDGVSRLLDEGDKNAVGLNVARRWAAGIGLGTYPDNPATIPP